MKLTDQQRKVVEDNHNLIYWYINAHGLELDEWYDLLAIELCYTVMKHDPEKSSLSNYFKLRADGAVCKEYRKTQATKRMNNGLFYTDDINAHSGDIVMDDELDLKELLDVENGEILRLKYEGYTQNEIATALDVSQSYVSKVLKKLQKEYHRHD